MTGEVLPDSVLKVPMLSVIEVSPEQLAWPMNTVETCFDVDFGCRLTWQYTLWFISGPRLLSMVFGEQLTVFDQKSGTVAFSNPNVCSCFEIDNLLPALSLKLKVTVPLN